MSDTDKLWDTIKDIRTGMLTTQGPDGLDSRPMSASVDRAAGKLWVHHPHRQRKTGEIANDAAVNVAFAAPGSNTWVSVSGTARVVRDAGKAKQLWSPFAEAWMPEGPDAPTTALIEVTPSHATIWDAPNKLVQLVQVAAANITQKPPSGGDVTT